LGPEDCIEALQHEWGDEDGCLWRLRQGVFDPEGFARLLMLLRMVEIGDATTVDRRFVALTWFIPLFMSWQKERVLAKGCSPADLRAAEDSVTEHLYRLLGVP
jgi:hypothetical protein